MKFIKIAALILCAACAILAGALFFSEKPDLFEKSSFGKAVLDRDGNILKIGLSSDEKYRLRASLDQIPDYAIKALTRYEDKYFYSHPGVNIFAIVRSVLNLASGARKTGASTLTMQVARMRGRLITNTISGKCRQIWDALRIERHYGKDEILEAYFNLASYGGNIEGIEAASRIYFNKPASRLTRMEIQALTVIPQNPTKRRPLRGAAFQEARENLSFLLGDAPETLPPLNIRAPGDEGQIAPHLTSELLGGQNGDVIQTYIERDLQLALRRAISGFAERGKRFDLKNAAAMIVDAYEAKVVACVGSADFNNIEISGQIDGTRARRSPGSTLKPFIYALALDQGLIHPATILPDSPRSFGGYDPENFDYGFRGPVSATDALKSSRNLPAILLAEKLRYPDLYAFLKEADADLPGEREHYGLSLALGGAEIGMRELCALYATLLNGGVWRPLKFTTSDGEKAVKRVLSPEAAWLALHMLERPEAVIKNGASWTPYRYKTGTSNGYRDAWTIGAVGRYVVAVWIGNFNNEPNPLFVGAKTALPLFQEIVASLSSLRDLRDRQDILLAELNLDKAPVCLSTGDFAKGQCREQTETYYIPGVSPVRDSGISRPILIDRRTGLRACVPDPENTEEKIWEFWPSDLKKIFEKAGIYKPDPPDWLPECKGRELAAPPPRIISPKKNVVYYKNASDADFAIPLIAAADADAGEISWYAGAVFLGKSAPGDALFWRPGRLGTTDILAVDSGGRTSRVKCDVSLTDIPAAHETKRSR